ncbi:MAG: hypothetical protein LBI19_00215 [Oscillospiraceae bacterium]|jgi:hypothetical protein|nr:hypothetical protein [Oscillospiraceae bacterium]
MTKRIFILLAVCFLLLPALPALADLLFEPDNSFFARNQQDCIPLNRSFYANGSNGYVSVKTEPDSKAEVTKLKNGSLLRAYYTYTQNRDTWVYLENYGDDRMSGWVPMDQLALKYDYISFEEEHGGDFYQYMDSYRAVRRAETLVFWTWPGSGEFTYGDPATLSMWLTVDKAYRDTDGRVWGFIRHSYGVRNVWLCLFDPSNDSIPAFNPEPVPELVPPPEIWPPADDPDPEPSLPWLAIGLVAGAVVCTVVLIRVFWKPKRSA